MKITTTQVSTFQDCPRKWYIHKILGVPDLWNRNYLFGSVLHACLERWYLTRGTGIVPEHSDTWENGGPLYGQSPGDEVELFPEGWEWHKDRDGSWDRLSEEEAERVRASVLQGFEDGTVDAPEDAIIESAFEIQVIDGVDLVSLADCLSLIRVEVQDHKSAAAPKWLKTPEELANNLQLIIYAMHLLRIYVAEFGEEPESVRMRHNGFVKRAPFKTHVRYAEIDGSTHIPVAHVKAVWEEVQEIARQMVEVSGLEFEEVPATTDRETCSKYGGCPYKPHCRMNIGLDTVAKSITAQNARAHTITAMDMPPIPGQAAAPSPSIAPPETKPPFLREAAPAPAWPRATTLKDGSTLWQKEPFAWGQPSCKICGGSGAHEKSYCPSCVEFYDGPLSAPFLVIATGGENSQWLIQEEEVEVVAPPVKKKRGRPKKSEKVAVVAEEVAVVEEEPEVVEAPEKKRGRPKKSEKDAILEPIDLTLQDLSKPKASESFTLCIGVGASSKKRQVIALAPVVEAAKIEIARRAGVSDFYEVVGSGGTPWMRREELSKLAPWVIEQLRGKVVTFYGQDDPEVQGLLVRVEAAAAEVFRA